MEREHLLPHRLNLNERKALTLTGATEVISFDETTVILSTALGQLSIHGSGLQLKNLSAQEGQVAVEGQIDALIYQQPRHSGLRRLRR